MNLSNLAVNLSHLRTSNGYAYEDIAAATGLSPRHLERYENEFDDPPVAALRKLCEFFNVGPDDLIFADLARESPAIDELLDRCREHANTLQEMHARYDDMDLSNLPIDHAEAVFGRAIKMLLDYSDEVVPLLDQLAHYYYETMKQHEVNG